VWGVSQVSETGQIGGQSFSELDFLTGTDWNRQIPAGFTGQLPEIRVLGKSDDASRYLLF